MAAEEVDYEAIQTELTDVEQAQPVFQTSKKEIQGTEGTYSAVIETIVPVKQRKYFADEWSALIYNKVVTYKGFRTRHVHLVNEKDGFLEYITVLVFDDYESFTFWQLSDDRLKLVALLKPRGITAMHVNAYGGCGNGGIDSTGSPSPVAGDGSGQVVTAANTGRVVSQNALIGKIPRPMPPPKWKLYIILLGTVYTCLIVMGEGSMTRALLKADQPDGFTLLLGIIVVVTGMTYSFLPLLMCIPFVSKWLRRPRSVPVEEMHPVHAMLDQGLLMFAAETHEPQVPIAVLNRLSKLEVKCDRLRSANHDLRQRIGLVEDMRGRSSSSASVGGECDSTVPIDVTEMAGGDAAGGSTSKILAFGEHTRDSNVPITMAVRHHVKWECVLDFEKWTDAIDREMGRHKGYMGMVRIDPAPGESLYINSFTFDTFDNLVAFTRSRGRNKLLAKLDPMLESTSAYEINEERLMGNAWSELFVSTGGCVPNRPPPLWKSCILTICPLFILVFQLGTPLNGYLAEANIEPHVATLIVVAVMVSLMTYFAVPTMHMFFGKWLNMPRRKVNPRFKHLEYLEFLDTGIPMYIQVIVLITFILANVLTPNVSE